MSKKVLKLVVLVMGIMFVFGGRSYANVGGKNNSGRTPLHLACERDDLELVKMLLKAGADVNAKDNNGDISLHLACKRNDLELVQVLIEEGSDVNIKNNNGDTPLHIACRYNGTDEILELLIKTGTNINAKNNQGDIPLHIACCSLNKRITEMLLFNGSNINEKNNRGNTPLHVCFGYNYNYRPSSNSNRLQKDVVELLLKNSADINLKNNIDDTVLDKLFTVLYNEMLEMSQCKRASCHRDKEKHKENVSYLVNEVEFLLEKGAVSNTAKDIEGNDLLSFACKYGYNNIVKLLVDK